MTFAVLKRIVPSWKNSLLAVLASALLILSFPDFEYWFLAWFALVPLMWAVERETKLRKPARSNGVSQAIDSSIIRSFVLGWIFGTIFFFGTCWWLTYAPINYATFPPVLAYFLLFCVTAVAGLFPGIFAGVLSILLRRFGSWAFLAAPFVWVFTEFLRYWLTGNNWNALGYSQAFSITPEHAVATISNTWITCAAIYGGVFLASAVVLLPGVLIVQLFTDRNRNSCVISAVTIAAVCIWSATIAPGSRNQTSESSATVVAVQANVPMSGLSLGLWETLRQRHVELTEQSLARIGKKRAAIDAPTTVVFSESPMNFLYSDDREFRTFIGDFARRNNVSVLFNSAEPDKGTTKYFNSAVMVGPDGKQVDQYDKIYLLPFGEAVPSFLEGIVPGFVGNFAYGREYDLFPVGEAKAGVMICFESHFGQLSREYVRSGADAIIEMTNDGYLGPTPILRQHLANAVFRAVETNRPVLRVTNVGITAYITEKGEVLDATTPYQEDTRVWSVSKSDGSQTFYVKYGDWFAWLCSLITFILLIFTIRGKRAETRM